MTFQVGDVVRLRHGGGAPMKVEKVAISGSNEWVTVIWGVNDECHNYFAAEMLQRVGTTSKAGEREPTRPPPTWWQSLISRLAGRR